MAGKITGTDGTPQADALPDAAWFAEQIMKKPLQELCEVITVIIGDGEVAQFERAWDPLTTDADALQLVDAITETESCWFSLECPPKKAGCGENRYWYARFRAWEAGDWDTLWHHDEWRRLAICRAVHAWWLAQQGVHNTGTGE